jgi:cytoskeletal protein RodZ
MLVNINEVANRLKISNRAVQIKCQKQGILKIGNQYQITQEIAEQWYNKETEPKRTEAKPNTPISYAKRKKDDSFSSFLFWISVLVGATAVIMFYLNLDSQIKETKKELFHERSEHKTDVKELQKIVDSQKDIISTKEIEIQRLKLKDSLRIFKP